MIKVSQLNEQQKLDRENGSRICSAQEKKLHKRKLIRDREQISKENISETDILKP
jgi:hypothetical protein